MNLSKMLLKKKSRKIIANVLENSSTVGIFKEILAKLQKEFWRRLRGKSCIISEENSAEFLEGCFQSNNLEHFGK